MKMGRKRIHAIVHGRVQGVAFREHTRKEAVRLGVSGWVRNRPDGTVEVVAEGESTGVDALLAWAKKGPPLAQVLSIDFEGEAPVGDSGEFSIRFFRE